MLSVCQAKPIPAETSGSSHVAPACPAFKSSNQASQSGCMKNALPAVAYMEIKASPLKCTVGAGYQVCSLHIDGMQNHSRNFEKHSFDKPKSSGHRGSPVWVHGSMPGRDGFRV